MQKKTKIKYTSSIIDFNKVKKSYKNPFDNLYAQNKNVFSNFQERIIMQSQRSSSRFSHLTKNYNRKSQGQIHFTASNLTHLKRKSNAYKSYGNSPTRQSFIMRTQKNQRNSILKLKNNNFPYKMIYRIGFGGLGKVWKVQDSITKQQYAMKCMLKKKVILKQSIQSIMNQRIILSQLYHPFIINMHKSFQDQQNLYLTMDYLRGGDLRYHLCYKQSFSQLQTKFIVSCLLVALDFIHKKGIIHRDIKPQNIVFDQNGYLRITDFGIAKLNYQNSTQINDSQPSGTPGYMAPQVIFRLQAQSPVNDFFSLGIICFQLMFGQRPYIGANRNQIKAKMKNYIMKISKHNKPQGWSQQSIDFVNKLLEQNPKKRLGFQGIQQIKSHPWLKAIRWKKLQERQITPPFIPNVISQSRDYLMQIDQYSKMEDEKNNQVQKIKTINLTQFQHLFASYDFIKERKSLIKPSSQFQILNPFSIKQSHLYSFKPNNIRHTKHISNQIHQPNKENLKSHHRINRKIKRNSCENIFSYLSNS